MARQDSFVFELTQGCNHECPHCYNAWKNLTVDYPRGELGTAATLDILGKLLEETGARLVSLSGGEPMLRRDFYEVVDFLKAHGAAVNLITNGSLLDDEAASRLEGKISVFELPLLSVERAIHDRLSGRPGAFDRATAAMAELKRRGQRVVGVFVATRLNLPTWRATAELAVALGLDGVMFNRFNPGGAGIGNLALLQATPGEVQAALDVAEEVSGRYDLPVSCSIAMPPCLFDTGRYKRLTFGFCAAGTARAYYTLDPLGNVRPCNHTPTILGNIRRESFAAMAGSTRMRDFRAARPKFCAGCKLETECMGGCKAAAEAATGSACELDPFLAAFMPQAVRQTT